MGKRRGRRKETSSTRLALILELCLFPVPAFLNQDLVAHLHLLEVDHLDEKMDHPSEKRKTILKFSWGMVGPQSTQARKPQGAIYFKIPNSQFL